MFPTSGNTDAHIVLGAKVVSPAQGCYYGYGRYNQELEASSVGSFNANIKALFNSNHKPRIRKFGEADPGEG